MQRLARATLALALLALATPAWAAPDIGDAYTRLKASKARDAWPKAHRATLAWATDVRVEDSGLAHVSEVRLDEALGLAGARALASLRVEYDPATQAVQIERVRVIGRDGVVRVVDPRGAVDAPAFQTMIYWGLRTKLVEIPGVRVGDAVEVTVARKGFQIAYLAEEGADDERYVPPMRGHFYDVVAFGDSVPVVERRYAVSLPAGKTLGVELVRPGITGRQWKAEGRLHYAWEARDLPPYEPGPVSPALTDAVPKVVLATVESWPEKSRWFHQVNEPVFASTDAIKQQTMALVKDAKTDEERFRRLTRWVARAIRYSGISMGQGEGYTIHPSAMTFQDRAGVCKDKAGMLVTMLRDAGYEAYAAMTMAGATVEQTPADQFNHAVVAVRVGEGEFRLLDPTWVPFSRHLWSLAEGEQEYVIGTPEGGQLQRTPAASADDNVFRLSAQSRVERDGTLTQTLTIEPTGYPEDRVRRVFGYGTPAQARADVAGLLAGLSPWVRVKDVQATNPNDLDGPTRVRVDLEVPGWATGAEDAMRVPLPLVHPILSTKRWAPWLSLTEVRKAEGGLFVWYPVTIQLDETLRLPAGARVTHAPAAVKGGGRWASWDLSAQVDARSGAVRLVGTIKLLARRIPPEGLAEVADMLDALAAFRGDVLVTERR